MSRSQDIIALLRGIQLVAGASRKTQEAYLKHLWSHSSVRELVEKGADQTIESSKRVISNPGQELQNVGNMLKETLERTSVVVEGVRQYATSNRSTQAMSEAYFSIRDDSKSYSTIKNIPNLDIASITLRELENLLAEHNKLREVNLRMDPVPQKQKKVEVKFVKASEPAKESPKAKPVAPKPKVEQPESIAEDEQQVASVMKFITNYDREPVNIKDAKNFKPEVIKMFKLDCIMTWQDFLIKRRHFLLF